MPTTESAETVERNRHGLQEHRVLETFDSACGSLATFASRMIRTNGVNRAYVTVFQRHVHGGKIILALVGFQGGDGGT